MAYIPTLISSIKDDSPKLKRTKLASTDNVNSSWKTKLKAEYNSRWNPEWWELPIWNLPLFQLINHTRYTILIADNVNKIALNKQKLAEIDQDPTQSNERWVYDGRLKKAMKNLSKIEADFQKIKMMEAIFESGPQFILQMSIILKVGNIQVHQAVTIFVSIFSFWLSTTKFLLTMPTRKTPLRFSCWKDLVILFFPTLFVVIGRLAAWSLILAYLESLTTIVVLTAFLVQCLAMRDNIDVKSQDDILGMLATILTPCIPKDEYSQFYAQSSVYTTLVILTALPITLTVAPDIAINPPILTCFPSGTWQALDNQTRCYYNQSSSLIEEECLDRWITIGADTDTEGFRTVCHNGSSQKTPLLIVGGVIFAIQLISLLMSVKFLQPYLDPVYRLQLTMSLKVTSPIWNEFYETKVSEAEYLLNIKREEKKASDKKFYLVHAIKDNNDSLVKKSLDSFNLLEDRSERMHILKAALSDGNPDIVEILLNKLKSEVQTAKHLENPSAKMLEIFNEKKLRVGYFQFACRNTNNFLTMKPLLDSYGHFASPEKVLEVIELCRPLHFASNPDLVKYILAKHKTLMGTLLFQHSPYFSDIDIRKISLERTLEFMKQEIQGGVVALHKAAEKGYVKVFETLMAKHDRLSLNLIQLQNPRNINKLELKKQQLETSIDFLTRTSNDGRTVLHFCIKSLDPDIVNVILQTHMRIINELLLIQKPHLTKQESNRIQFQKTLDFLCQTNKKGETCLDSALKLKVKQPQQLIELLQQWEHHLTKQH